VVLRAIKERICELRGIAPNHKPAAA